MNLFYLLIELFATVTEGAVVFSVSSSMSSKRYGKRKHMLLIIAATVIYTALITYLNHLNTFSFITIAVAIAFSFAVVSLLSSGSLLLKAASIMITWFFMHTLDYTLSYILIMVMGRSLDISKGVELILSLGTMRTVYLLILKTIQIVIFSVCAKLYPKLRLLDKRSLSLLLVITTFAYLIVSVLTSIIFNDSVLILQLAVIISHIFIIVSIVLSIFTVSFNARHQKSKRDIELMMMANTMMEKNFREQNNSQNIIRQQVHDFKNHIRTISGMSEVDSAVREYTDNLLAQSYEQVAMCHSGNDIIDSIINCKYADALKSGINFTHRISLSSKLNISSVDICAILANQLDNALEACEQIEDISKRYIKAEIYQKESFVFFKVINSCEKNPFDEKHELKSSKLSSSGIHGYGVKNIIETAQRNGGTVKNEYNNGEFVSVVMVLNNK